MQQRHTTVAVVDDDASILQATEALLVAQGFRASLFGSAEEFLASGAADQADCLLLDINLGRLSGIELRRLLNSTHSGLPVIFMTALEDDATCQTALRTGCIALLHEPFQAKQLGDAITKACTA